MKSMQHRFRNLLPSLPLRVAALTVLVLASGASGAPAAEFVPVPADKIRPLISGATVDFFNSRGEIRRMQFFANGDLFGDGDYSFNWVSDDGKWWTGDDGDLCLQFYRWLQGKKRCGRLSLSDRKIRMEGGDGSSWVEVDGSSWVRGWDISVKGPATAQVVASRNSFAAAEASGPSPASFPRFGEFRKIPPTDSRTFIAGMTINRKNGRGFPMVWDFGEDGNLNGRMETPDGETKTDSGKWWVNSVNAVCFRWKMWAKKRPRCFFLGVDGDVVQPYNLSNGSPTDNKWKIRKPGGGTARVVASLSNIQRPAVAQRRPPPRPVPRAKVVADTAPPIIDAPASLITDSATVEVKGRVGDKSQIVELSVNGRPVAFGKDGAFSFSRGLPTGVSTLTVVAVDEWGNRSSKNISVTRKARQVAQTRSVRKVDNKAPDIDLPSTLETKQAFVAISGKIADASQIIEVTVNRRPVPLGGDGSFSLRRGVPQGASEIVVAAVDEWGNRAEKRIRVNRAAPPPVQVVSRPPPAKPAPVVVNPFAGIHFGKYHALVIGNNGYKHLQKLKSARNDADAVSRLLKSDYGFSVTKLTDATRGDILGALAKMRATLKPDDNLLIYYAGHGVVDSVAERGFWLPVDAEEQNPANWISNDDLTGMLRAIRARHVMVVADSCYSGTLVRAASVKLKTSKEKAEWVKRIMKKRGRTALVSGGLEPVTDSGGSGGHSVFARAFLDALKSNTQVMEGRELFDRLKRPVVLNTDQTPRYSDIRRAGHEGGEFIFVRKN